MRNLLGCLLVLSLLLATSARAEERILHHEVYFKLKDNSAQAKAKFIAACEKYLTDHSGTVWFAVGEMAEEFQREVNNRDFDVVLQVIFTGKAAHDAYMKAERHVKFIEETKPNWEKVRVFDWYVKVWRETPLDPRLVATFLRKAAKTQILAFMAPLQLYRLDQGDYPTTAQGLQAIRVPPKDLREPSKWSGPYLLQDVLLDPWKRPYHYQWPSKHNQEKPDIWSSGPDGIDGTEDDVVGWDKK
jgi:type II secretion system protein G